MSYTEDVLYTTFREFDRDKSGTISGGELRQVLRRLGHEEEDCETIAQACFDGMDTDKNGWICKKEMLTCYKNLGCSDEEAAELAEDLKNICDKDGDAKISWEEFKKYFPDSI